MQWLSLKIVFEGKWNSFPLLGFSQCSYIYWILFSHNDSQRALYMEFSNHVKQRKNKIIIFKDVNCDTKTEEMTGFFFLISNFSSLNQKKEENGCYPVMKFYSTGLLGQEKPCYPITPISGQTSLSFPTVYCSIFSICLSPRMSPFKQQITTKELGAFLRVMELCKILILLLGNCTLLSKLA